MKVKSESEVAQSCPTLRDPMDYVAYQVPPSMRFSRQEYWSGLPLPMSALECLFSSFKIFFYLFVMFLLCIAFPVSSVLCL